MAEKNGESTFDEINHLVTAPEVEEDENSSHGDSKDDDDMCSQNQMPSQKHEEEVIKKKYGGLLPKKPPLISKDHERAFFDSADWALGKVITRFSFTYVEWKSHNFALYITQVGAQKSKGPLEALRPKLEPSPHHHARSRSAYAPAGEGEDGCNSNDLNLGLDQDRPLDSSSIESHNRSPEIQNLQN
ncbi:hypothetical protein ACS0TY_008898 [Phlomoides rotata]